MDYRVIADNSPILMAITPAMLGIFSLAWTVLRKSWRVFGFGLLAFDVPFSCFLAAEVMAVIKAPAALPLFISGCLTLGIAVVGYGSYLVLLWRKKEASKKGDFDLSKNNERKTKSWKRPKRVSK